MKAIRIHEFGGPEVMRLEEVPDPVPGAGEAVVRLRAIGVNPVDTYIRAGNYGPRPFPLTPGSDGAGIVETIGIGVSGVKPGERVYVAGTLSGTYAEKTLCDARKLLHLPDNVTFSQGAGVAVPYATAYRALFQKAEARKGQTVLIHGASGGVGTAAVQLAKNAGLISIATAGTDEGRGLVLKEGATHAVNHRDPNYLKEVLEITNGRGVDIVLEMLANVNLGKDLTLLAKGGCVVVIGSRGTVEINPRDAMRQEARIYGMSLFNASDQDHLVIHSALGAGLANGALRPVVGKELPLAEAARAHKIILEAGAHGKIVLIP